jgi:cobalt/nickel transport system permease protein
VSNIPSFLLTKEPRQKNIVSAEKHSFSFIDRTLKNIAGFIGSGYQQRETAARKGLLRQIDARVKVVVLAMYTLLISFISYLPLQLVISAYILLLYILSRVPLLAVYKKVFVYSFVFGFLVFAPAALNLVTGGEIVFSILKLQSAHHWWIYHLPAEIGITSEGITVVARMSLKVFNSLSLTLLIINTTPFTEIIKSLKVFKVPDMFLLIITLTYKFIFILSLTIEETYFALKLRWWRKLKKAEAGNIVAGRITHIFRRSWARYEETWHAMEARGFTGDVNLCYLHKIKRSDIYALIMFLGMGIAIGVTTTIVQ